MAKTSTAPFDYLSPRFIEDFGMDVEMSNSFDLHASEFMIFQQECQSSSPMDEFGQMFRLTEQVLS